MAEIIQLVPSKLNGKSFSSGRTPFEVLLFERREEFDFAETETDFKKHIVAKLSSYGDALLFAQNCAARPAADLIILRA